jgi:methylated-DNA-protein-cysteine methyltransferase related protein
MNAGRTPEKSIQERIYDTTRQIPYGKVATYGQVAMITGACTARMVGYAMAAVKTDDIPWQRVINAKGKISPHGFGYGSAMQRQKLEDEGVEFDKNERIDFNRFGWLPEG